MKLRASRVKRKSESTPGLIDAAYRIDDEDEYWGIIGELQNRGSSVEFDAAKLLAASSDSVNREIAADILGQLDWSEKKFHDDCVSILVELLKDNRIDVIASAAFSLGHRNDPSAIPYLVDLMDHSDPRVRHGVVMGLSGFDDERSAESLIILSSDSDFDVRNWATFGLASQCDIDTPALRRALFERISDKEYEIRGEALIGLAVRNDLRITDAVIGELKGEFNGDWAVEAAMLLAREDFCFPLKLLKLKLSSDMERRFMENIDDAISTCCQIKT